MRKNNIFDKNNSKQLKEYNNENKLTAKIWKEQKQKTNNHKYLEITLFGKENSKGMEKILRTVTRSKILHESRKLYSTRAKNNNNDLELDQL